MTRARTQYKLVGRYLNGNDTKYYGLVSEENKQVKYTSEQMAFMVGRGQVVNVGAQIYQGRLLFRGQNCDIKSLPTIQLRKDKDTGKLIITPVKKKPGAEPIVKRPVTAEKPTEKKKPAPVVKKEQPVVKKVQPEDEYVDPRLVESAAEYLGLNIQGQFKYSVLMNKLLATFNKAAYDATKTMRYMDMTMLNLNITVDYADNTNKMYYIHFNKWGSKSVVYAVVSESTFEMISYEYPDKVFDVYGGKVEGVEYKPMHYHELVIRLGLFSRIPEFKRLKLWFMKYNKELFDNKISSGIIMMIGNYADKSDFVDLRGCGGYSCNGSNGMYPLIMLNYKNSKTFNNADKIDRYEADTLLHEMSHAYVDAVYGSNVETDPNKMGDVLYGMRRDSGMQYTMHGEKFGTTVQMISDKTGLSFNEIFAYGVHINNEKRETEFTKTLINFSYSAGYDNYDTQNKPDSLMSRNYKGLAKVKEVLVNKQDYLKEFFRDKFNMTLEFYITDDDSKVSVTNNIGSLKNYDINFSAYSGKSITVYRQMDDR